MIRFIYKCHACGHLIAATETCDLQDHQAKAWVRSKLPGPYAIPYENKVVIQGRVVSPDCIEHKCNSPCAPQGVTGIATIVGYREEK